MVPRNSTTPLSRALLALITAGCCPSPRCGIVPTPYQPPSLNELIRHELHNDGAARGADDLRIILRSPIDINPTQFRTPLSVANPGGFKSTLQEQTILVDWTSPVLPDATLSRRYTEIATGANCAVEQCPALNRARELLSEPQNVTSPFRVGWPDWRPVEALPVNWAETRSWLRVRVDNSYAHLDLEYVVVWLQRGWLSVDFLSSPDWFVPGMCAGDASDASLNNDDTNALSQRTEALPLIPVGFVLARHVEATEWVTGESFQSNSLKIIGWYVRSTPFSPPLSDPAANCSDRKR